MNHLTQIGWRDNLAGLGVILALGLLYGGGLLQCAMGEPRPDAGILCQTMTDLKGPFAVCCLTVSMAMILAGRMQEVYSHRMSAVIAAILVCSGLGLMLLSNGRMAGNTGFAAVVGLGLGFGHAAATPAAIRWLPPVRKARHRIAIDFSPLQMLKTGAFHKLWFMVFSSTGAALIVIAQAAEKVDPSAAGLMWIVMALTAVAITGGCFVARIASGKKSRTQILPILLGFQAAMVLAFSFAASTRGILLAAVATSIGFAYGTHFGLFSSLTREFFGHKYLGLNNGLIFSAWGISGLLFPRAVQFIIAQAGTPHAAYLLCSMLLVASALIALTTHAPGEYSRKPGYWFQVREKVATARAQPVDVYLGTRHF